MPGLGRRFIVEWNRGLASLAVARRVNQDALFGSILCDPDDRGVTTARPGAGHGHGGVRRDRQQRCQKPGDCPLVHSTFSIRWRMHHAASHRVPV